MSDRAVSMFIDPERMGVYLSRAVGVFIDPERLK